MASLDIVCFNPFNLKNNIMRIEHILWSIKNFEKYFMTHEYMPKIFQDPHKNPPPPSPTYLMYGPLSQIKQNEIESSICHCKEFYYLNYISECLF